MPQWIARARAVVAAFAALGALAMGSCSSGDAEVLGGASGDDDPYAVAVTECESLFLELVRVEGTVTNTSDRRASLRVEIRFERRGRLVGGGALFARELRPGEARSFSYQGEADKRKGKLRCRPVVSAVD